MSLDVAVVKVCVYRPRPDELVVALAGVPIAARPDFVAAGTLGPGIVRFVDAVHAVDAQAGLL